MAEILEVEEQIQDNDVSGIVNKNIVLFLFGKLVSLFGSSIYSFAIGLYVLSETGSGKSYAMTIVLTTLPRAIFGPISGVFADKLEKKKLAVVLDVISGLIVLGLLGVGIVDGLKIHYIYLAILLLNITNVFFDTTISSSIPKLVTQDKLQMINSFSGAITSLAFILGPFLGAIIIGLVDIKIFLLINGLSFIFSGITEMALDFKVNEKKTGIVKEHVKQEIKFIEDLKEGLKYIVDSKWILSLALTGLVLNGVMILGLNIPLPVVMYQLWSFTELQYGIVMSAFPFGMFFASIVVGILPQSDKCYKQILIGLTTFASVQLIFGLTIWLTPLGWNNWIKVGMLCVIFICMAIGGALMNIPLTVALQKNIDKSKFGRVMGVMGTVATITMPVAAFIGGYLIEAVPAWTISCGCSVIMILVTINIYRHKIIRTI